MKNKFNKNIINVVMLITLITLIGSTVLSLFQTDDSYSFLETIIIIFSFFYMSISMTLYFLITDSNFTLTGYNVILFEQYNFLILFLLQVLIDFFIILLIQKIIIQKRIYIYIGSILIFKIGFFFIIFSRTI